MQNNTNELTALIRDALDLRKSQDLATARALNSEIISAARAGSLLVCALVGECSESVYVDSIEVVLPGIGAAEISFNGGDLPNHPGTALITVPPYDGAPYGRISVPFSMSAEAIEALADYVGGLDFVGLSEALGGEYIDRLESPEYFAELRGACQECAG